LECVLLLGFPFSGWACPTFSLLKSFMCGRFTLRARLADLLAEFVLTKPNVPPRSPRYNIAPTQPVFVVRAKPDAVAPTREAAMLRWGLIPSWASDPSIGNRMINARAETVAEKPAFRAALRRRRCLLVADGFYEWKAEGRAKHPYFIHFADDRPFAFAGLWEHWEGPDHASVESCTLITAEANALMRPIHDRMPVILPRHSYAKWLDPAEQESAALLPLLTPYPDNDLEAYPVNRFVNSPSHDAADCLTPLA
jgi:putative SOS response-associated peptidase YedK